MADSKIAFLHVMQFEDDPAHPGKISAEPHGARARLGVNSLAHPDMPDIFWTGTYEEALPLAEQVFVSGYWNPLKLDGVKSQDVANKVADMAFNMGVGTAARLLQRSLGVVPDGVIGLVTMAAIDKADPGDLLTQLRATSAQYYEGLLRAHPDIYGAWREGWLRRAAA